MERKRESLPINEINIVEENGEEKLERFLKFWYLRLLPITSIGLVSLSVLERITPTDQIHGAQSVWLLAEIGIALFPIGLAAASADGESTAH